MDFMSLISFHSYEGVQTNEIPLCSLFKQHTVFRSHTIHIVRWIMRIAKSIKRHIIFIISIRAYLNTRTKRKPCILSSAKIYSMIGRACLEHCKKQNSSPKKLRPCIFHVQIFYRLLIEQACIKRCKMKKLHVKSKYLASFMRKF